VLNVMLPHTLQDSKDAFEIETLEVELFGPDGRLKDIWMFRWAQHAGPGITYYRWPGNLFGRALLCA